MNNSKQKNGFTLVELLATLTIMAIIAAILFPMLTNYVNKANHDTTLRSLRILQEAMDRYRMINTGIFQWPLGSSGITGNPPIEHVQVLTDDEADIILENIITAGSNQTLKVPIDQLNHDNMYIATTGTNQLSTGWEVVWFRRKVGVHGVDKDGNAITNWSMDSDAIDKVFLQEPKQEEEEE